MSARRTKPPRLRAGDTVGVVAPAAAVEREHLERGVNALSQLGFRVKVSQRVLGRAGILAGDDRERAAELQSYFADPEVRAIIAARGGYGTGRILPLLDFAAIARTPKPFVGFSDLTFLLTALVERANLVAFHGPTVAVDLSRGLTERARQHLVKMLGGEMENAEFYAKDVVHRGTAEGEVTGGCLSVLAAMLATPY
ncbi:MAG: S66 peptidase family protein, partial [Candidatus Binataceae bacterium]